jgi:hypothetical protein
MYTNQSAFDAAATHLIAQGRKCFGLNIKACAYRGPDGTRCAVGALIPDELYDAFWESNPIRNVLDYSDGIRDHFEQTDTLLLVRLQMVHDLFPVEAWPERLRDTAKTFGLTLPACLAPIPTPEPELVEA